MTTEQWICQWIDLRSAKLKPRTIESYRDLLRLHIAPAIGRKGLKRVKPEQIQQLLADLCAAGHSRTAELCYVLLRASMRDAVRSRHMRYSPMDAVQRPDHRPAPGKAWTPDQCAAYLMAISGNRHRLAFLLALLCGLRRGEICGLRWADVDLRARVLHIRNQRIRLATGQIVDAPPKSDAGVRDVPIPVALLPLLRGLRRIGGYVDDITPSGLDAAHRRALIGVGLPYIRLHDLRHTMATNAVRHGATMRALQAVLGHAHYQTTADMYTHPDLDMLRGVVDAASAGMV